MKVNNIFIIIATLLIAIESQAQDLGTILFGKDSKVTYMGQYNYNGKRKNGFGIERYKNGGVYIGDFSENNISGRGMYISAKGQFIDKKNNACIYVGGYRNGKKSGKGTYYDAYGNLIYDGKFENDKPLDQFPSINISSNKRFIMVENNQELYWGEALNGLPNGMGLKLDKDGCVIFGKYKEGEPTSIGMIFYSPEVWEVGRWSDGEFQAFNNSQIAKRNLEQFKQARKYMWTELAEAGKYFVQAGVMVADIVSDSPSHASDIIDGSDNVILSNSDNDKEENDKKREEKNEREKQNKYKKNDKLMGTAYSKCEDNLIDMYVHPERYSNLSKEEFRRKYKELQNKLKRIRTDHEQKTGSKYYVSEYETKTCPI